jgi:signal transduction histidine kinase
LGGGKYSEYIHTSAEHLLALVNDMLDVSAIIAGQWRLHRETVAIGGYPDRVVIA